MGGGAPDYDPHQGVPEPLYSLLWSRDSGQGGLDAQIADYYSPGGGILTGPGGEAVTRTGERGRLAGEVAPDLLAGIQGAGLSGASPWFGAEQLGRQTQSVGGDVLGGLDDYMASARKFLGVAETGEKTQAAPAAGTTAQPASEEALVTAGRGRDAASTISGIAVESELGDFLEV